MSKDPSAPLPFAAPKANLEAPSRLGTQGPGWFWSVIFALPFIVAASFSGLAAALRGPKETQADVWTAIQISIWFGILVALILASGWWWARRASLASWRVILGFALGCGALGQVWFVGGMWFIMRSDPVWGGFPIRDSDDLFSIGTGWAGMSLYALFQGLLIRWALKRRARRRQASTPAAAPLS